jgi:hypothetical protein
MRRIESECPQRVQVPYTASGLRHVRVVADGRLILFASGVRRDRWLKAQTGRVVRSD